MPEVSQKSQELVKEVTETVKRDWQSVREVTEIVRNEGDRRKNENG